MLFPTTEFAVLFAAVFGATWALQGVNWARKLLLLLASYAFYAAWDPRFVLLLLFSALWNYGIGLWLGRGGGRGVLALGVTANLLTLAYFKYWDFLSLLLAQLTTALGHTVEVAPTGFPLPVAISFLTFHGISYIVDVSRKRLAPTKNPLDVMLYAGFFPHLVAGPIVRADDFMGQLSTSPDPAQVRIGRSILLIVGGLFKKIVVSSNLSTLFLDRIWVDPTAANRWDLLLGVYAYGIVIYCDFSAYTDMAIGIADLLGYRFPQNFNQPYRAQTLSDFWRRWHMSLSSWLRDYLFIPLGGSRGTVAATQRNLFLTMLLGGLWHGAGLQFLLWGAMHGVWLGFERLIGWAKAPSGRLAGLGRWFVTVHVVLLLWIPFRAPDLGQALAYLQTLLSPATGEFSMLASPGTLALMGLGVLTHCWPEDGFERLARAFDGLGVVGRATLAAAAVWIISLGAPDGIPPFIYFQF